jgi:hypothetical protein
MSLFVGVYVDVKDPLSAAAARTAISNRTRKANDEHGRGRTDIATRQKNNDDAEQQHEEEETDHFLVLLEKDYDTHTTIGRRRRKSVGSLCTAKTR